MSLLIALKQWIEEHRSILREDYFQFLRFPSISTDPQFAKEVRRCAEWLCGYIGNHTALRAELIETEGYPIVYAENLEAGAGAPTLLIYGHYDVQPVDPLDLWQSPPFEPTERHGKIYARGAVDDKGQIFYAILAMRSWKELGRRLPINVKFCIEGEEESSSLGLSQALGGLKQKLRADSLLVVDFDQFDREFAALSLGARGLVAFEVTLTGSQADLHSGVHGGMAYNPNRALAELLSKLWDDAGRVRVPGFYDDVLSMTQEQREQFSYRYTREQYTREFGVEAFGGDRALSLAENNWFQPTLEINGMSGGYTGAGFKTVIPAQATAKISARLVPDQDPEKIADLLATFLKKQVAAGMKIEVHYLGGEKAFRGRFDSPLAKAVAQACEEASGKPCKKVLSGGSIPIVAKMIEALQVEVVGMGYGLPTDNIHAPNEHFEMSRLEKGFLTVARTLELL